MDEDVEDEVEVVDEALDVDEFDEAELAREVDEDEDEDPADEYVEEFNDAGGFFELELLGKLLLVFNCFS